ncbi:hypothetical protein A4X13_0g1752 [Tilletia indica]|uniref:Uncharacterized protein n=1 Tax=Tilletia indica TaxID=43049 RepID=A0A177TKC8_9BASI|nr:hypothetical protein A4X13_0g1752 [Tilletia indica]
MSSASAVDPSSPPPPSSTSHPSGLTTAAHEGSPTSPTPDMDNSSNSQRKGTTIVWALHDFDAEAPDEVSFKAGDKIVVEETDEQYNDNWWLGTTPSGETGLFPSTYTTPDKAVMLASRSAFEAVPGGEDDDQPPFSTGPNNLMGNTMAELDDALKQMQRDPRSSYAPTEDFDNMTELGDEDRDERGRGRSYDEDEDEGDDFLASQSTAARAALALKAKSNALSVTERERTEAEQRKVAAQKRVEEEEERQRALLLLHSEESIKNLAAVGNGNGSSTALSTAPTGLQRKPTLTSRIPLKDVEVSDESDSEGGDHHNHHHQKQTQKGKAVDRSDETKEKEQGDEDAPTPSIGTETGAPTEGFGPRHRMASDEVSMDHHSIMSHSGYESGLPTAFSEVAKLHEAAAAQAAAAAASASATSATPATALVENWDDVHAEETGVKTSTSTATMKSVESHAEDDPVQLTDSSADVSMSTAQSEPSLTEPDAEDLTARDVSGATSGRMTPTASSANAKHIQTPPSIPTAKLLSSPQQQPQSPGTAQGTPTINPAALPSSPSPSSKSTNKEGAGAALSKSASKSSVAVAEPGGDPHEWTVEQVAQWGRSKNWDETAIVSKFIEHEITGDVLLEMDVNILKEIEITAFGKRFQVATGIKELLKRLEEANNPTKVAAVANGWTVSNSPAVPGMLASTSSSMSVVTADESMDRVRSASVTSSPLLQTVMQQDARIGSPSPQQQQMQLQEEMGVALSPPSNDAEFVSMYPGPGSSGGPSPSIAATGAGAVAVPAPVPAPGPTVRNRVSFSQTVQTVPPPAMNASGYNSPSAASSSRMRVTSQQGPTRSVLTNAQAGGGPIIGVNTPAWPAHLITIATGQGIGNVYAGGDKRDSRSSQSMRGARDSYTAVSPSHMNYGLRDGASSFLSQSPPPMSLSSNLPPGGGTIPPPLLLPRRRESSNELKSNGGADGDSPHANGTGGSARPPSERETNGGRAGERTSFFATFAGRSRKPAPRASQYGANGSDLAHSNGGIADNSMGSGSSGSVSKQGGFSSRFKRENKDRDRDSAAFSDTRLSQTGSLSPASGGPHTQQGRSSFGSGTTGRPQSRDATPSMTPSGGVGGFEPPAEGGTGSFNPNRVASGGWECGEKETTGVEAATAGAGNGESVLSKIRPVDLEGWMLKKGERYSSWKPRYLALKGPDLVVLRSPDADKIKGYISMKGYRVIADENTNPGKYGFKIVHEQEKAHHFSSADPAEVRAWMKALMKATIGRDHSFPVISSYNNKTISLREAQSMYPPPRPPSPNSCLRVQRANIRANPNSLSAKDAAILTGLIPKKSGSGSLGPLK